MKSTFGRFGKETTGVAESTVLGKAAASTRESIRQDIQRVSSELRPILLYAEAHAFDDDFSVARMIKACRVKRRQQDLFSAELGRGIKAYVNECRMEVVGHLLSHSDIEVWQISTMLGFTHCRYFSQSFKVWSGKTPTHYRELEQVQGVSLEKKDIGYWFRAALGVLEPKEAKQLMHSPTILAVQYSRVPVNKELARMSWRNLESMPQPEVDETLRLDPFFGSPDFVDLLGKKSLEEGRKDRVSGLRLAELAVELVEMHAWAWGEIARDFQILAWARLGNARRLALDLQGADTACQHATSLFLRRQSLLDSRMVEAELSDLTASLRLHQRRFSEAQSLLERTIVLTREIGDSKRLASALIQRAVLHNYFDDASEALADLREALQLLDESGVDDFLRLAAYTSLVASYAWANQPEMVIEFLPVAKALCNALGNRLSRAQLTWIEGLAHQLQENLSAAESMFREARAELVDLGERGHAGALALELAVVCFQEGRWAEAADLASEAILLLKNFKIPDVMAASRVLGDALGTEHLTLKILEQVRKTVRKLLRAPTLFVCLPEEPGSD